MATIVDRLGRTRHHARTRPRARRQGDERPLWQQVAALYTLIVLIIVFFITAAFLITYLATGSPY